MVTGGSRGTVSPKLIPGPTVAATMGVPTAVVTFSLAVVEFLTGSRTGSPYRAK